MAAELQQRLALAIAQRVAADQGGRTVASAGDAVAAERLAHRVHPLGDERAKAKEGSRGAGGHGVMVAAAGRPGQVWFWAAQPADRGKTAGSPHGRALVSHGWPPRWSGAG
ncbi:hypothetical protein I1E95_09210 [Synechococcus sp. CBW1107]|uniref:hypothetical protein n=1 Tax=Synechococcus sp. CBW1107 TaxID=2789857 RepID=UPI0018CD6315|nr:hypothetical protein [Synechococcus sp. CBW1107]QPN55412.1 hypothetical protein I1E95_09210 [Synechococcus sp. CBW1107]